MVQILEQYIELGFMDNINIYFLRQACLQYIHFRVKDGARQGTEHLIRMEAAIGHFPTATITEGEMVQRVCVSDIET